MTLTRYTIFQYFSVSDSLGKNQYERVVYMAHVDFGSVGVLKHNMTVRFNGSYDFILVVSSQLNFP